MKIAVDCRLIGRSGIGTYIENIVRHAVQIPGNSYVLIGDRGVLSCYEGLDNCSVVACDYGSFTWKELLCFPVGTVNGCDAFFTPNFNIPRGIRVPVFCTIHDVVFLDVDGLWSPLSRWLFRWYLRRAFHLSQAVFTVSEFSKGRIEQLFHPQKPLYVAYNGVSQELIDYRRQHLPPQRKNQIVCLGNLKEYKGIPVLLEAFQKAKQQGLQGVKLVVVGNMDFRSKDSRVAQSLQQSQSDMEQISGATNREVYDILASSRLLVSPSLYEGFGLPPLEALYLGTPVLLSDIPVYREVYGGSPVQFFRSGDSADLADKICRFFLLHSTVDSVEDHASSSTLDSLWHTLVSKYDYSVTASFIMDMIRQHVLEGA